MLKIERLLMAYTVWLFNLFDISPGQIERSRSGRPESCSLRLEGARGLNF